MVISAIHKCVLSNINHATHLKVNKWKTLPPHLPPRTDGLISVSHAKCWFRSRLRTLLEDRGSMLSHWWQDSSRWIALLFSPWKVSFQCNKTSQSIAKSLVQPLGAFWVPRLSSLTYSIGIWSLKTSSWCINTTKLWQTRSQGYMLYFCHIFFLHFLLSVIWLLLQCILKKHNLLIWGAC